jgi:hypothetical protein
MRTSRTEILPAYDARVGQQTLRQRLWGVAAHHTEEILAEVAPTLRRLRTLLLVATISLPLFFAGLLIVMWHLAR